MRDGMCHQSGTAVFATVDCRCLQRIRIRVRVTIRVTGCEVTSTLKSPQRFRLKPKILIALIPILSQPLIPILGLYLNLT